MHQMKKLYKAGQSKLSLLTAMLFVSVATSPAYAAIDASVGTSFAAVETDAKALAVIVTPYVVSILGLVIVIKLIKRFGNKI